MTVTPRRRGRRSKSSEQVQRATIAQVERQRLRNRFAPVEALDEEHLFLIHNTTMELLETQGIEVLGEQALDVFRKGGADVDDQGMVRLDRALVM